jgi:xanthine dehydrogenase YagT iron-sulfur-binding subunit
MSRDKDKPNPTPFGFNRRRFLQGVGAVGVGALLGDTAVKAAEQAAAQPSDSKIISGEVSITLHINGQDRTLKVEPRTTLLSALRDRLEPPLTGPKLVCDMGTCGCCTVLLDGKPVYGCLVLAIDAIGVKITTVEGLGTPDKMNEVQAAFVEKDAMMCGFCTSGFVTRISALLEEIPTPTIEEVREHCKGNFCRCGTYPHIFQAALAAADAKAKNRA